jgi:hypothetical protein
VVLADEVGEQAERARQLGHSAVDPAQYRASKGAVHDPPVGSGHARQAKQAARRHALICARSNRGIVLDHAVRRNVAASQLGVGDKKDALGQRHRWKFEHESYRVKAQLRASFRRPVKELGLTQRSRRTGKGHWLRRFAGLKRLGVLPEELTASRCDLELEDAAALRAERDASAAGLVGIADEGWVAAQKVQVLVTIGSRSRQAVPHSRPTALTQVHADAPGPPGDPGSPGPHPPVLRTQAGIERQGLGAPLVQYRCQLIGEREEVFLYRLDHANSARLVFVRRSERSRGRRASRGRDYEE